MVQKLIIYPVLALITIGYIKAGEKTELKKELISNDENLNEWVMVQNENGIAIFFSEFIVNSSKYLKIKFENTNAVEINFKWSLKNGSEIVLEESINNHLKSAGIFIYGNEKQILIKNEESFKGFLIVTKLN